MGTHTSGQNIKLCLFIFIFLYAPPIIPQVNILLILTLFSALSLTYKLNTKSLIALIRVSGYSGLMKTFFVYLLMWLSVCLINITLGGDRYWANYISSAYSLVLFFLGTGICSLYLVYELIERKYTTEEVILLFIKAGMIEAAFTIAAFIFPTVRSSLISVMRNNTGDAIYSNYSMLDWRFYGFSNSMLDLFGVGTGVIASLPLYLFLFSNRKRSLLYLVPLLFVPLLNSRTGLVVFVIMFVGFLLLLFIRNARHILSIPVIMIALIFLAIAALFIVNELAPNTADWILMDVNRFLSKGDTVTGNTLFSDAFWELPSAPFLLVGTGHTKYLVEGFSHSDVGYVNQIWRAGIFGTTLLFVTLYSLISSIDCSPTKQITDNERQIVKFLLWSLFFVLIITNIKCDVLVYSAATAFLFSMTFYLHAKDNYTNFVRI